MPYDNIDRVIAVVLFAIAAGLLAWQSFLIWSEPVTGRDLVFFTLLAVATLSFASRSLDVFKNRA